MPLNAYDGSTVYYSACTPNCWMNCRLYVHVRDGKIVQTSPAPFPDPTYNRICLRGLSHPERVYNKERVTFPLKRAGKRGENKWQRISWEEAYAVIAENLNRIKEKYGSRAVAFAPLSGNYGIVNGALAGAISRFAHQFGGTLLAEAIDMAIPTGISQVMCSNLGGMTAMFMGHQIEDVRNAKTFFAWGTNLTESQPHNWHFVADCLDRGGQMVVIEPRFSELAKRADEWVRVRPGSDAALILSMINVILEENLIDYDYVVNFTVAPFLVREDNGKFLRESDLDPKGSPENYLVLDEEDGKLKPVTLAAKPSIWADYTVNNIRVRSALILLKEEAEKFKPEEAVKITTVPAEQVRKITRMYALNKPSFIYDGFGTDRWDNGDLVGRGLATIAALTGNVGKPGGGIGVMGGSALGLMFAPGILDKWLIVSQNFAQKLNYLQFYDAATKGKILQYMPLDPKNTAAGVKSIEPEEVPYTVKALIATCSNMVSNMPNQNMMIKEVFAEDKLEFVVVADQFLTDTARQADIFLPAASWFEAEDVAGGLHPYLMKMEKAIEPLGEAKSDFELFKGLAEKMGMGEPWQRPVGEYIEEIVRNIGGALGDEEGITKEFKEKGIVRLMPSGTRSFADNKFFTPTGRAEFYSEGVIVNDPSVVPPLRLPVGEKVKSLPHFRPPDEAWPENPLYQKYPLVFIQLHSRWRVHSQFYNIPALKEIDFEPYLELNENEIQKRGLKAGDLVRVFNDRGEMVVRLRCNNANPDGLATFNRGWQQHQFLAGGYQELTSNRINRVHFNCSFFDTLVEVEKVKEGTAFRTQQEREAKPILKEGGA